LEQKGFQAALAALSALLSPEDLRKSRVNGDPVVFDLIQLFIGHRFPCLLAIASLVYWPSLPLFIGHRFPPKEFPPFRRSLANLPL
jgi:hypothetical protein